MFILYVLIKNRINPSGPSGTKKETRTVLATNIGALLFNVANFREPSMGSFRKQARMRLKTCLFEIFFFPTV